MQSEFAGNVASIQVNSLPNSFQAFYELDLPNLTTCWSTHSSFDKALGARPTNFVLSDTKVISAEKKFSCL